jgi:hypothetical protein
MGDKVLNDRPGYLDIILGHKIMVMIASQPQNNAD